MQTNDSTTPQQKAMITGGGGLLGRAMFKQLTASGWKAHAFPHIELDSADAEAVRRAVEASQPILIITCAATADVDRCEREPDWAYAVNEEGPRHLAQAARDTGAEIVQISPDYVFDGTKEGFYTQEDEPHPLGVYAKSKLAGERAA